MKARIILLTYSLAGALVWIQPTRVQSAEPAAEDTTNQISAIQTGDEPHPTPDVLRALPVRPSGRSSRQRRENRTAVMNRLVLKAGETVRDAVVVAGSADINGTVDGDMIMVMSQAKFGPQADIKGDLIAVGTHIEADPAIHIGGERIIVGGTGTDLLGVKWLKWPQEWVAHGVLNLRPLPHQHAWAWGLAALSILVYVLAAILFPKPVQAAVEALVAQPGQSFLFGVLALVLLVPGLILLTVTGIGVLLVPFVLGAALVIHVFGKAAFYSYAGQQLGRQLHWARLEHPVVGLMVGTTMFCLLYMIPVLGLLLWAILLPLAVGGVIQAMVVSTSQRIDGAPGSAAVLTVPVTAATAIPGVPATGTIQLSRAGFWVRLLATLLDLVLVFFVAKLFHGHDWFLLLWVVYHVGFWTWRGTTAGGLLLGLKIIRTNGAPIDFAVALVRSLAGFLSFVALGLGFFWAGWTREKQSWHDRIADTLIVKLPKPAPILAA